VFVPILFSSPAFHYDNFSGNIVVSIIIGREMHRVLLLSNGNILVIGGQAVGYVNDVWQSSNGGATWNRVTASAGWAGKTTIFFFIAFMF
jgi:hypothetical protein